MSGIDKLNAAKKAKGKKAAKKKAKKPSRDFRGKKNGVIDAGPGPIQRAMGLGSQPPC